MHWKNRGVAQESRFGTRPSCPASWRWLPFQCVGCALRSADGVAQGIPESAVVLREDVALPSGCTAAAQRPMVLVERRLYTASLGRDGGLRSPAASSEVTGFCGWSTPASGMADCDRQQPLRRSPAFVVGPLLHCGVHTSLTGSIMTAAPFASTWLRSRWNAGKGRCTNGAGFDSRHPVRAFRVKRIAGSFSASASVVSGSVPQFAEHDRRGEVARLPATFRSYS
jgi:hypothetical protein